MKALTPARIMGKVDDEMFDVIIIGGGLSGLTTGHAVAQRKDSDRILILEAGPLGPRLHLDSSVGQNSGFARWAGQVVDPYAKTLARRMNDWRGVARRVVGGRGLYWGGVLCRIDQSEFLGDEASLQWLENEGFDQNGQGYDVFEKELIDLGVFRRGGEAFPTSGLLTSFRTVDCALSSSGRSVFSPVEYFDLAPTERPRASILTESTALSLTTKAGTWTVNCVVKGQARTLRAQSVVLAAGLIENCRLLEAAMKTMQPYRFTEHLVSGVACFVPQKSQAYEALFSAVGRTYIWGAAGRVGFNLFLLITERENGLVVDVWGVGEKDLLSPIEVYFDGRVLKSLKVAKSQSDYIKDNEMLSAAQSIVNMLVTAFGGQSNTGDRDSLVETKRAMRKIHLSDVNDWQTVTYVSGLGSVDHEACLSNASLRFDSCGRLEYPQRLYIAGPGALKRMGSANPNLSALALAYRVGKMLA